MYKVCYKHQQNDFSFMNVTLLHT